MKSLKDQLCLDIITRNNVSLADFVRILDNPLNSIENTLASSCTDNRSPVWKFLIDRDYTPTLLLSRMDIEPDEYAQFARRLIRGDSFHYIIIGDWGNLRIIDGPRIIDHPIIIDVEGDTTVINFDILGVPPQPGSIGYVVRFYFDDPVKVPMSIPKAFILGPDHTSEDIAELYRRMKLYLAAQFKKIMVPTLTPRLDPFAHHFDHRIAGRHFENLATDEQLEEIFDEHLTGNGVNMSVFQAANPQIYLFQEYIISVSSIFNFDERYLTMFFDVGQLRF